MLRILGGPKKLCGGVTRRDWLRIGGLGMAGLTLPQLAALQQASANESGSPSFGRAKSVILIHLYGAPSQIEWVDPKPDAPVEVRGELGSIKSSLPGCDVCELMPNFAKVVDRCTVLRSLTHPYPIHGVAFALTGVPIIDVAMELSPRDPRHWPFFGSAVEFVERDKQREIPSNLVLPFRFSSKRKGEVSRAGPYAAFLGPQYDPLFLEYVGEANRGYIKTLQAMKFEDHDPYVGLKDGSYFVTPGVSTLSADVTLDRLHGRRSLLEQLNDVRHALGSTKVGREMSKHQAAAWSLMESTRLSETLDLRREDSKSRELYGPTLFGQSLLAARRLVEAGGRVVTVFWDEYGLAGSGWDTHWDHYGRMRNELCPGFDLGFYGLITDLDQRGLLDDTLVVCTSEHGRTPKISSGAKGAGRDHWSRVYSSVIAGGGVKRGCVVGKSDAIGGDVADRPISPKDLLATMYHLLGIDHRQMILDRTGRPLPLVDGEVIHEALV
jgi:hypothetical protein